MELKLSRSQILELRKFIMESEDITLDMHPSTAKDACVLRVLPKVTEFEKLGYLKYELKE